MIWRRPICLRLINLVRTVTPCQGFCRRPTFVVVNNQRSSLSTTKICRCRRTTFVVVNDQRSSWSTTKKYRCRRPPYVFFIFYFIFIFLFIFILFYFIFIFFIFDYYYLLLLFFFLFVCLFVCLRESRVSLSSSLIKQNTIL